MELEADGTRKICSGASRRTAHRFPEPWLVNKISRFWSYLFSRGVKIFVSSQIRPGPWYLLFSYNATFFVFVLSIMVDDDFWIVVIQLVMSFHFCFSGATGAKLIFTFLPFSKVGILIFISNFVMKKMH